MTTTSEPAVRQLSASRSLMVVVYPNAIGIPEFGEHPQLPLDLARLTVVEHLARADGTTPDELATALDALGADVDEALGLLDDLRVRGLLCEGPRRPPTEVAEALPTDAADLPGDTLVLSTPVVLRLGPGGFELHGPDGMVHLRLSARELLLATCFQLPSPPDEVFEQQQGRLGAAAYDRPGFDALIGRLVAGGMLQAYDPDNPLVNHQARTTEAIRRSLVRQYTAEAAIKADVADKERLAEEREAERGVRLTRVVPVHAYWHAPPLTFGLLFAYAKAYRDGMLEDHYHFVPRFYTSDDDFAAQARQPGIFLFSNYIWSHEANLGRAALVKRENPFSITIHGGPDTPKYEGDSDRYFAEHPQVDITVHGEGEATFAELLHALRDQPIGYEPPDLSVLGDVPGLSFRLGDRAVHTGDRPRIEDLDTIPSPYLTGLFDAFGSANPGSALLETNRGCPYGCTFCDWGSATLSRIRKFDLDRVMAELEWISANKIELVSVGDANFGIFERDVEIAAKVVELKQKNGYPKGFGTNYAKNTVKHLRQIIEMLASADILAEGIVSLQSMDKGTLTTIRRSNIKLEKYNELSNEFRSNDLPLAVDIMMGLPGSTPESYRNDLQECINRDVRVRVHNSVLLANSPMNDPAYRAEHGITARPGEYVRETATFTETEWRQMALLRDAFLMVDKYGVLRHMAKFVRSETGEREVDVYERILSEANADRERWPTIAFTLLAGPRLMSPPASWNLFIDEVHEYLVQVVGLADDSALRTVLDVQLALLPAPGRRFPLELSLEHDYAAWHQSVMQARDAGHRTDWETVVPRLATFEPATFTVDDPEEICLHEIGKPVDLLSMDLASWDLRSPVSRAHIASRFNSR